MDPFEGTLILAPPIFIRFSLFLIPTHYQNLIHLALMVEKFKILKDPFEGFSQPGTPDFRQTLVLPDVPNRSKLEYYAFSGLKEDSSGRKRIKSKKKDNEKKTSIQVGVNELNRKKGG